MKLKNHTNPKASILNQPTILQHHGFLSHFKTNTNMNRIDDTDALLRQ